jgi:hypothetical protein
VGSQPAADKIWLNLKLFIQEAYQRCLNATGTTSGQHGYVQNAFGVLAEDSDDEKDADVHLVITQMATLTTQCQLMATTTTARSSLVASAIQQLSANQQSMMQQIAALTSTVRYPPAPAFQVPLQAPPSAQFSIPDWFSS